MLSIFSYTYWSSIHLRENSDPLPLFCIGLFAFFAIELYEFFIYFRYEPIRYTISKCFFLFPRLPFHFVDGFLCWAEAFKFSVFSLAYFYLYCLCFCCQIKKKWCQDACHQFSFKSFMASSLTLVSLSILNYFLCVVCKVAVQFYPFACRYPVFQYHLLISLSFL